MIARFVCFAMLLFAGAVLGEGTFQRTQDDKTLVWNNSPKPGDSATWDGDRDDDGYADGFGTVTWYSGNSKVFARFYGNMVHGKFDGPVNAHSNGETAHAIFIEGKRASRWRMGRAPSQQAIAQRVDKARERIAKKEAVEQPSPPKTEPAPEKTASPESKPPAIVKAEPITAPTPEKAMANQPEAPADGPPAKPQPQPAPAQNVKTEVAANKPRKGGIDESLTLLARPPSTLRSADEVPSASPSQLTEADAIDIADARALDAGYDLTDYYRPKADFNASNENWSVLYNRKSVGASSEAPEHFNVTVGTKTKKTVIVPGK